MSNAPKGPDPEFLRDAYQALRCMSCEEGKRLRAENEALRDGIRTLANEAQVSAEAAPFDNLPECLQDVSNRLRALLGEKR